MGRIAVLLGAVVLSLAVGLGAGWLALDSEGETTDADRACGAAEELPPELGEQPEAEGDQQERIVLLNRIAGIGLLAQAAGQDGPDLDDLDALGQAGYDLYAVMRSFDTDAYAGAREALLEACSGR